MKHTNPKLDRESLRLARMAADALAAAPGFDGAALAWSYVGECTERTIQRIVGAAIEQALRAA